MILFLEKEIEQLKIEPAKHKPKNCTLVAFEGKKNIETSYSL